MPLVGAPFHERRIDLVLSKSPTCHAVTMTGQSCVKLACFALFAEEAIFFPVAPPASGLE
jgi:hypothetical protein